MQTFRLIPALEGEDRRPGTPQVTETANFNMLTAELEAFADILHGVEVFEAILRSAATGQAEKVTKLPPGSSATLSRRS